MTTRTFRSGAGVWFVVHMDTNGNMTGYEYHNWREGGLSPGQRTAEEWEAAFLREVAISYKDDAAVPDAEQFLVDMRKGIMK